MKATETGRNMGVFGYGHWKHEAFHLNHGNSNNIPLLCSGAGWYTYWDDTPAQDDGQWHHWMVFNDISDTEGFKLYVDGVQIDFNADGTSGTPGLHSQGLTIGGQKHDTNNDGHAEGSITNFAVFSGDKTSDVVAHYNNGIPVDFSGYDDLEGYWKMDDNTGTTVKDYSSDGNDGTFDGDEPTWITALKETDHIQNGIPFIENLTTGQLEDNRH